MTGQFHGAWDRGQTRTAGRPVSGAVGGLACRPPVRDACGVDIDVRYTRSGGVAIAYQVVGDGGTDLVFVPDFCSNLVYGWESPYWRPFYERLSQSFRLILFDKRGTGLSDRGGGFPTLETRMEDVRAVLDAVGSDRAVVFGSHEGCLMATMFAATYPESTVALALFHPSMLDLLDPKEAEGLPRLRELWGTRELCDEILEDTCPTLAATPEGRSWFANWLRVGASPAMGYELNRAFMETDMRDVYAAVRVPALVMYRDTPFGMPESLAAAALIPESNKVCVSGRDYWGVFLSPEVADEIERLVAGEAAPAVPESILTTVMFTDIVGSSERASALGDRAWRDLLAEHHGAVRRELVRFRGEERDTAGDGFFATFDGPARAIRCGQALIDVVQPLGLELRVGIHTGECELHDGKVAGVALSTGARICSMAQAGEVLVSRTVRDLVAGSGLAFEDRGRHHLKGVGEWEVLAVRRQ
jgi:class 3 adenylate cyclase/pimeloyl-ACP methyl ester carboxylesterase